jgi:hypothetical protein
MNWPCWSAKMRNLSIFDRAPDVHSRTVWAHVDLQLLLAGSFIHSLKATQRPTFFRRQPSKKNVNNSSAKFLFFFKFKIWLTVQCNLVNVCGLQPCGSHTFNMAATKSNNTFANVMQITTKLNMGRRKLASSL